LRITRRQFCESTAKLALAGAVLAALPRTFDLVAPALAQVSTEELMVAGPLGDVAQGDAKAPVTLIEYASLTCPHCADFYARVYPVLKERYIDTGKLRFIFREFPRDGLDLAAFMLARCAGEDKFLPFIDVMFERQKDWAFVKEPRLPMMAISKQAGFTQASFEACLTNQQIEDGVRFVRDRAAEKLKVDSTPTLFINGKKYSGAYTPEAVGKEIEGYLKS